MAFFLIFETGNSECIIRSCHIYYYRRWDGKGLVCGRWKLRGTTAPYIAKSVKLTIKRVI